MNKHEISFKIFANIKFFSVNSHSADLIKDISLELGNEKLELNPIRYTIQA